MYDRRNSPSTMRKAVIPCKALSRLGTVKFMLKVADSKKKLHILSGLDLGTIEKNIINKDLGIIDIFGALVQYNASQYAWLPFKSYIGNVKEAKT